MKRTLILSTIAVLLTTTSIVYFAYFRPSQAESKTANANVNNGEKSQSKVIAAPGVVESVSEEIEVGAELAGKLKSVLVEEGDEVLKGQIIAVLENADFVANIAT
ncbi:MAG: biotin/lipoyl-binding protein, partial [Pyrinomonadaceae bacterium]|nr:biotin/lipoyl-binding protein [Pyrinomonadaceae bacterium]